jgi:hypothetical protein
MHTDSNSQACFVNVLAMATLVDAAPELVAALRAKVLSDSIDLPAKYRAMYSLRNVRGDAANGALLAGG